MTIAAAIEESVSSHFFAGCILNEHWDDQAPCSLASADPKNGVGLRRRPSRRRLHVGRRFHLKLVRLRVMGPLTRRAFHFRFAVTRDMSALEASETRPR